LRRSFDQLPESASLKYVRGNAGFTGFRRAPSIGRKLYGIPDLMRRIAKEKSGTSGQRTGNVNLLIANSVQHNCWSFLSIFRTGAHADVPMTMHRYPLYRAHRYSNGVYVKSAGKIMRLWKCCRVEGMASVAIFTRLTAVGHVIQWGAVSGRALAMRVIMLRW